MKGITKEFTIWCSHCSKWEQYSFSGKDATYDNAVRAFKAAGWKVDKKEGKHLCPNCKPLY